VQQRGVGSRIIDTRGEWDLSWRTSSPHLPPETPRRRGGPRATCGDEVRQPRSHPGTGGELGERESAAALHLRASHPSPRGAKGFQVQRPEMICSSLDPKFCFVTSGSCGRGLPHFISAPPARATSVLRGSQ
jgi:hypothetical protein